MLLQSHTDVQGHRGCRGLMPENTLPAMYLALDMGVKTLEMDVVITSDSQVILSHEPFMSHEIATSPEGSFIQASEERNFNIYKMSLSELQRWDVGMKPHPRFPRQKKIRVSKPTLAQVIDSVEQYTLTQRRPPAIYNIETKINPGTDDQFHPAPARFVQLLMEVISAKGIEQRTIIQSFDPRSLREVHKNYPGIRTALLVEGIDGQDPHKKILELGFKPAIYSPEYHLVSKDMISYCHNEGISLIPWTVNDKSAISNLLAMGVDGIITDYPDLFQLRR